MTEKPAIIDSNNSIKRIQESVSFQDAVKIAQEDKNYTEEEFVEIYRKFPERAVYSSYFEQSCGVINEAKKLLGILKYEVCDDKKRILNLVSKNINLVFELLDNYKDKPWAKDVLSIAISKYPFSSFNYYYIYKELPLFKEVLEVALNKDFLIEATKKEPFKAFDYLEIFKNKPWAKDVLIEAAKIYPSGAFSYFDKYKDKPWAKDILVHLINEDESLINYNISVYIDEPWAKDILIEIFKKGDFHIFSYIHKFKDKPWAIEVLEIAARSNPFYTYYYFDEYSDKPWAMEILKISEDINVILKAVEENSFIAFDCFQLYKDKPWAKDVLVLAKSKDALIKATKKYASKAFYYKEVLELVEVKDILVEATKKDPFKAFYYFENFKDKPWAKDILIEATKIYPSGAFFYFEKYKDKPWAKDVLALACEVIKNDNNKDYLKTAYAINHLHNEQDEIRYLIIDNWGSKDLYKLVYEWREEIFTSTYNWIANRLLAKLKNDWKDIYEIILENNFEWVAVFFEATTSYWRFSDFFENIKSSENKKVLLQKLVESVEIDLVKNSVALMEIIKNTQDNEVLNYIWELIKKLYEKWWNSKKAFGIIWRFWRKYFNDSFFDDLPIDYDLQEIKWIPSNELFDKSWRNVQQYYFYNDNDGKASFDSFISNYKKDTNWKIEDKESFLKITSKQSNWNQIIIFANKPTFDGETKGKDGSIDIKKEMNSLEFPLESIIIVHRWHSYHAQKTIDRIPSIAKMVFLWSCWGFQNIWKTLEKSPLAHIISTKWTWTKVVNDPLFKLINDKILNWEDIIWKEIWEEISKKVWNNEDFKKYIRPDQNLWVLFLNKYNSLD